MNENDKNEIYREEKEYLEIVSHLIRKEIEDTMTRYHNISHEKLSWEDRRRGQHFNNNAVMDLLYKRIQKLKLIISSPYFGRMDFVVDEDNVLEKFYIGKTNLYDNQNKLYTIDWRTPVAGMYYDSSLGRAYYEAPFGTIKGNIILKRRIIIKNATLQKVIDTDLVGSDVILQDYLDVHADNRMKNIVASIEKQQNRIIRHNIRNNIIVQGIAGSGKTSAALHRIVYLIYFLNTSSNNAINSKQFMIIGPNNYFLDYISSVLPDLDVEEANQLTLVDLVSEILKEKVTIIDQSKELQDYFENGIINGDTEIKNSANFELALNNYIEDLYSYYLSTDITFSETTIFDKDFIASLLTGRTNKFVDSILIVQKRLIDRIKNDTKDKYGKFDDLLTKNISDKIRTLPKGSEQRKLLFDKRELIRAELKTGLAKTIKAHFKAGNKTILQHYISFITNLEKYMTFDNIEDFKRSTLKNLAKKTLSRDDIASILLLKGALSSVSNFNDTIHIVIDEAQDLSILEFKAIKNLFPKATFSIFGDLNQSIFSYRSVQNWESVKNEVFGKNCSIFELNQSYRTTDEIMKEANKVSKFLTGNFSDDVVRHGETVDYIKLPENETILHVKNVILKNLKAGYKSIAIITKTENEAAKINKNLKTLGINIPNITFDDKNYNGGVCTIASNLVKGLEFDATILVNVNGDVYDVNKDIDMKLLYVAMTRALHKASIFYNKDLPLVLDAGKKKTLV